MDKSIWKRWLLRSALLVSATTALISCTANKHSTSTTDALPETTVVAGSAAKGPLYGAQVNIYRIGPAGPESTPLATTTTKDDGSYEVEITPTPSPLLIEVRAVAGTRMLDETRVIDTAGGGKAFPIVEAPASLVLRSIAATGSTPSIGGSVNLLTDLAAHIAASATDTQGQSAAWRPDAITGALDAVRMLAPHDRDPFEDSAKWQAADTDTTYADGIWLGVVFTRLAVMSSWCGPNQAQAPASEVNLTLTMAKVECLRKWLGDAAALTIEPAGPKLRNVNALKAARNQVYGTTAMGSVMETQFRGLLAGFNTQIQSNAGSRLLTDAQYTDELAEAPMLPSDLAIARIRFEAVTKGLGVHLAKVQRTLSSVLSLSDDQATAFKQSISQTGQLFANLGKADPCNGKTGCTVRQAGNVTTYEWTRQSDGGRVYRFKIEDSPAEITDTVVTSLRRRVAAVTLDSSTTKPTVGKANMVVGVATNASNDWLSGNTEAVRVSGTLAAYGTSTDEWVMITIDKGAATFQAPAAGGGKGMMELSGSLKLTSTFGLAGSASGSVAMTLAFDGPAGSPTGLVLNGTSPQTLSMEASVLDKDGRAQELMKADFRMTAGDLLWSLPQQTVGLGGAFKKGTMDISAVIRWLGIGRAEATLAMTADQVRGSIQLRGYGLGMDLVNKMAASPFGHHATTYLLSEADSLEEWTAMSNLMGASTLSGRSLQANFGALRSKDLGYAIEYEQAVLLGDREFTTIRSGEIFKSPLVLVN